MTACPSIVSIRQKFPLELSAKLWRWLNDPRDFNFDDFGPRNYAEFVRDLMRRLNNERTWAILADGEIVGYLGFAAQNPIAGQFRGMVVDRLYRSQGIGREAMAMAIQEVLADGFSSLVSMPFRDNSAISEVLKFCGFREVGMLQNATRREGMPVAVRIMQFQAVT